MAELLIVILLIIGAFWLIGWLFSHVGPFVAKAFGAFLLLLLTIGIVRGLCTGIASYYRILVEVYGRKKGIAIGVGLSVLWFVAAVAFAVFIIGRVIATNTVSSV